MARTLRMAMVCLMALAAVGCGDKEQHAAPAASGEPAKAKAEPARLASARQAVAFDAVTAFKTTCAICHGESGEGDGPAAAALAPKPASFREAAFWQGKDKAHLERVIKLGGASVGKSPLMAPWGATFTKDQISALADHVIKFKP